MLGARDAISICNGDCLAHPCFVCRVGFSHITAALAHQTASAQQATASFHSQTQ